MKDNASTMADKLARRKRRIEKRLKGARDGRFVRMMSGVPAVFSTVGVKYELAERMQAIVYGGVPLMMRVARETGLVDEIDPGVPIFKLRCPYDESDHALNLAMNAMCEGTCLDRAIKQCRQAGFKIIRLRGDTGFSQTEHLDRWDAANDVRFHSATTRRRISSNWPRI